MERAQFQIGTVSSSQLIIKTTMIKNLKNIALFFTNTNKMLLSFCPCCKTRVGHLVGRVQYRFQTNKILLIYISICVSTTSVCLLFLYIFVCILLLIMIDEQRQQQQVGILVPLISGTKTQLVLNQFHILFHFQNIDLQ